LTVTIDDLELEIETTWVENCGHAFERVVVLILSSLDVNDTNRTIYDADLCKQAHKRMQEKLIDKIDADIGLVHGTDYIFQENVSATLKPMTLPYKWGKRIVIRLQQEEHFTMLKLHYNGN
jgi:hypothetical protein